MPTYSAEGTGLTGLFTLKNDGTIDQNGSSQTSAGGGFSGQYVTDLLVEDMIFSTSYNFNFFLSAHAGTTQTGTIFITDNSSSTKTFAGGGLTFNNLSIPYGSVGSVTLTGANTFNTFTVAPSATPLVFPASTTTTVTSFDVNGISNSAGSRVAIISSNPGTPWILSVSSGVVQPSFISLMDSTATGGAKFYAVESTSVSGNTGWTFQNLNPTSSRTAKSGQVAKSGRVAASGRVAISF